MIVCICRDIRDSEYNNQEDLLNRLLDEDVCCGKCIEEFVDVDKIGHSGRRGRTGLVHHKAHSTAPKIPSNWTQGLSQRVGHYRRKARK